ncbi:hypothetical protein ACGTN9_03180 [Halobacillus sp. MO56]
MKEVILLLAEIVNIFHDLFGELARGLGLTLNDKEMHFWIIGILGLAGFLIVNAAFHVLSQWSITAISFVFSFAMVLVFVFAVEIQQKITGAGQMEFQDAAISIVGFLAFFGAYLLFKGSLILLKKFI